MTPAQPKSRIAELEAEIASLKARVEELTPRRNAWIENIGKNPIFKTDREFNDFSRTLRQLKDADRELPKSPALTQLRKNHKSLITQLRKLGGFKSSLAAAEYAHRNFQ